MTYPSRLTLSLVMLAACAASPDSSEPDPDPDPSNDDALFATRTRSLALTNRFWQLSLTDSTAFDACGLAEDYHRQLSGGGQQILVNLGLGPLGTPNTAQLCPTGMRAIRTGCSEDFSITDPATTPQIPDGCAYHRVFSGVGIMSFDPAVSGTISVQGDQLACTFTLDLQFADAAHHEEFTFSNVSLNTCE